MPECRICFQERTDGNIKFATPRICICRWCVESLNTVQYSPQEAKEKLKAIYRDRAERGLIADANSPDPILAARAQEVLLKFDAYVALQFPWWLKRKIRENGVQVNGNAVSPSLEIRLIRAHLKGLVRLRRSYTKLPPNWAITSLQLKHQVGLACNLCNHVFPPDKLHAHHIVFRSHSGANNQNNLVVLCIQCHQLQHNHAISQYGGEPDGLEDSEDGPLLGIDGTSADDASIDIGELQQVLVPPVPPVSLSTAPLPRVATFESAQNPLPQLPVTEPRMVPTPSVMQPIDSGWTHLGVRGMPEVERQAIPMRWATFWIYFSLPMGVLQGFLVAVGGVPVVYPWLRVAAIIFVILQAWIAMQLRQRDHAAWTLNWIIVVVAILPGAFSILMAPGADRDESAIRATLYVLIGLVVWIWPNWVYWNKREPLFDGSGTLPRQWLAAAGAAWVCVVAMIILSIYGGYLDAGRHTAGPTATNVSSTTEGFDPATAVPVYDPAVAAANSATAEDVSRWDADVELVLMSNCAFRFEPNSGILQQKLNRVTDVYPNANNAFLLRNAVRMALSDRSYTPMACK